MSANQNLLVLVLGGTGRMGLSLITSMQESGAFRIAALSRPESASKPQVATLKSIGVEIRLGDFVNDSVEKLTEILNGVDVLISVVAAVVIPEQKNILLAAKQAGVKRVIPCDFATACVPGRRALYDTQLEIRTFVRELSVSYTFIDVGMWSQAILPQPSSIKSPLASISRQVFGTGDVKSAVTDIADIGRFVARIIQDPRTVDQYVFCWGDYVSQNGAYKIAERVAGEDFSAIKVPMSPEAVQRLAVEGRQKYEESGEVQYRGQWTLYEYANSIYIQGDNTPENAKVQGAFDARQLYPEFKPVTLEESAKKFYESIQAPQA